MTTCQHCGADMGKQTILCVVCARETPESLAPRLRPDARQLLERGAFELGPRSRFRRVARELTDLGALRLVRYAHGRATYATTGYGDALRARS